VRARSGMAGHGGWYRQEVVLADLDLASGLAPGIAHVVAGRDGRLFVFAICVRLLGRGVHGPGSDASSAARSRRWPPPRCRSTPGSGLVAVRPDGYVGFRGGSRAEGSWAPGLLRIGAGP
jgi:hypothetical protein